MSYFQIKQVQNITLPKKADCEAVREILSNYAAGIKWEVSFADTQNEITIGDYTAFKLEDYEYAINITSDGVYICGDSYSSTMRGLFTLLEKIFCYGKKDYRIDCEAIRDKAKVAMRSVHICLFPEYPLDTIRKYIRTCAVAKYTHILLESWGSIKLDTLKELAWSDASFSKDEIKELVNEAHALGMKMIPFFQHLGHASLARLGYSGKHVLLDQNPELEYLYYPRSYGWVWNFKDPEVREMLKNVRAELMELFGECEYFHLGCDEAGMEFDADELTEYLNELQSDLKSKGRRAIIWGDMLLSKAFFPEEKTDPRRPWTIRYECNSTPEYANSLLDKLDKDIIIADWQYNVDTAPWKSSLLLKEKGFDVLCCPWEIHENIPAAVQTIVEGELYGMMETTWNHLISNSGVYNTVFAGLCAWGDPFYSEYKDCFADRAYNIYRKVKHGTSTYETSGWSEKQV